jgi:hypothetical protein
MKKYFIGFCQLFLTVLVLNAQNECITPSPKPPAWIFSKSPSFIQAAITSDSRLNIFVHIVRSSNGTGLTTSILQPILSSLNTYYQGIIQFNLLGSDFIDNDIYYIDLTLTEANQLFNVGSHCNAIDIYILGVSTTFGGAGMAQDIPAKAYIVQGSYYNTSSLPHEMGHCLGLYHTHHGTVNEGGGDLSQCAELVNGSNSTTCGDYISDTPADPDVWSSNSCSYIGTGVDANGQIYHPSASNLMSYAYKPCRTNFSTKQIQRIYDFINNTQILQNTLFSTVSGPTLICSSGTFTVNNVPAGCTVYWDKSSNITLPTDRTTNPIVATANGNGSGWVQVTINSTTCGSVTLPQFPIWAGKFESTVVSGQAAVCPNSLYTYTAQVPGGHSPSYSYSWTYPSGWYNNGQLQNWILLQTPMYNMTYGTVRVSITNQCGTSGYSGITVYPGGGCPHYFTVYPNPASDNVTITIIDNSASNTDTTFVNQNIANVNVPTNFTVRIYNSQSALISSVKRSGMSFSVPLTNMRDGIYIVEVNDGKNSTTQTLIVKHN